MPKAPQAQDKLRIIIADDHALFRRGLEMVLEKESDIEVVGEAHDGQQAVDRTGELMPDVVLMDVRMPHVDGIEATRRLVAEGAQARILILTTFDLDEYVYEALRAGASGFLLKDATPEQLIDAIHAVALGESVLAPSVTRRVVEAFVRVPPDTGAPHPELETLTARELEVLALLARGHSNSEIAAELVVSEATTKTHVRNVLAKLGLRDRIQAVVFGYESGLIRPGAA